MNKLLVLCLAAASLTLQAAETHRIVLFQTSHINGTELKAGDYKLEVLGDKIVLKSGKVRVEAQATKEAANSKYNTNSILYKNEGGKFEVQEIHVGGTNTKLLLNQGPANASTLRYDKKS